MSGSDSKSWFSKTGLDSAPASSSSRTGSVSRYRSGYFGLDSIFALIGLDLHLRHGGTNSVSAPGSSVSGACSEFVLGKILPLGLVFSGFLFGFQILVWLFWLWFLSLGLVILSLALILDWKCLQVWVCRF